MSKRFDEIMAGLPRLPVYPNGESLIQNWDWIIRSIKLLLKYMEESKEWMIEHEEAYEELKKLYDDIMAGDFPESIQEAFENWMQLHANELVGSMVKNVFFGLTDAGYFVAYIPESWEDITFNTTGLDIAVELQPEYGHLVLSY